VSGFLHPARAIIAPEHNHNQRAEKQEIRMPSARTRVVVTRRLPAPVEARMQELFDVTLNEDDRRMTADEIGAAMAEADVLVPTITDRIDAKLLAKAGPQLRLIANYGAGFDHIDVATALQRGIMVSNTPGVLAEDTADMAMALILAVPRRLPEGGMLMQKGEWEGWGPTAMLGHRIAERGRLYGAVYGGDWLHVGDADGLAAAEARLSEVPRAGRA
jgi:lactate dehydrogenase-like 2-hydroxyacid dehydrogenase